MEPAFQRGGCGSSDLGCRGSHTLAPNLPSPHQAVPQAANNLLSSLPSPMCSTVKSIPFPLIPPSPTPSSFARHCHCPQLNWEPGGEGGLQSHSCHATAGLHLEPGSARDGSSAGWVPFSPTCSQAVREHQGNQAGRQDLSAAATAPC